MESKVSPKTPQPSDSQQSTASQQLEKDGRAILEKVTPFPSPTELPVNSTEEPAFTRPRAWKVATSLLESFRYAGMGFWYACRTQRNFRIHMGVAVIAISLSIWLGLTRVEMALIALTCGMVMVLELLNTALEAVVDLTVGDRFHELAKIAKDCAAAAVLVSAGVAVLVAGFLLLPPLLGMFGF